MKRAEDKREEYEVEAPNRRLDALARLLEGYGRCASVAFDDATQQLVVAYNKKDSLGLARQYFSAFNAYMLDPTSDPSISGSAIISGTLQGRAQDLHDRVQGRHSEQNRKRIESLKEDISELLASHARDFAKIISSLEGGEQWMQAGFNNREGFKILKPRRGGHAEIELIGFFIREYRKLPEYAGISKLCCEKCGEIVGIVLSKESEKQLNPRETAAPGSHVARGTSHLSLAGVQLPPEVAELVGPEATQRAAEVPSSPDEGPMNARRSATPPRDRALVERIVNSAMAQLRLDGILDKHAIINKAIQPPPEPTPLTPATHLSSTDMQQADTIIRTIAAPVGIAEQPRAVAAATVTEARVAEPAAIASKAPLPKMAAGAPPTVTGMATASTQAAEATATTGTPTQEPSVPTPASTAKLVSAPPAIKGTPITLVSDPAPATKGRPPKPKSPTTVPVTTGTTTTSTPSSEAPAPKRAAAPAAATTAVRIDRVEGETSGIALATRTQADAHLIMNAAPSPIPSPSIKPTPGTIGRRRRMRGGRGRGDRGRV